MNEASQAMLDRLPHQPPFRFVSEIIAMEPGVRGEAIWSVTADEWFLSGHFPENPIVPGVLIAEALAQLSGLVVAAVASPGMDGRLAQVDVRFDHSVVPPAQIRLHSRLERTLGQLVRFEVEAESGGRVCARGSLTVAVIAR